MGALDKAEQYLRKSAEINVLDAQSIFDLSKVLLHRQKMREGLGYFDQAIRFDYKYGLRAGADEDFIQFTRLLCFGQQ
jgi:tetratricopeptide (TPR) repeat protein